MVLTPPYEAYFSPAIWSILNLQDGGIATGLLPKEGALERCLHFANLHYVPAMMETTSDRWLGEH